jgi:hypothetical protein
MKTLTPKRKTTTEPRSELRMFDRWNSEAVRALINRKTAQGRKPAYLFVGQEGAELLRHRLRPRGRPPLEKPLLYGP